MQSSFKKFKQINPKETLHSLLRFTERHTVTILIIFAGILIGVSSLSVRNLTNTANELLAQDATSDQTATASQSNASLQLNQDTVASLLSLKDDADVSVTSNIASYRRSAFSDATGEISWVIDAARIIEQIKDAQGFYPATNQIAQLLRDQGFSVDDPQGRPVNSPESGYNYVANDCSQEGCNTFTLAASVNGAIYQLGETDVIKRSWVNDTAEALQAYKIASTNQLYPNEDDFTSVMTNYYENTFKKTFVSLDPQGIKVNEEKSAYSYRAIDCSLSGCRGFVLRTTFKDGALYFQQSQ